MPSKWSRAAVTSNSSVVVNTSPYPATLFGHAQCEGLHLFGAWLLALGPLGLFEPPLQFVHEAGPRLHVVVVDGLGGPHAEPVGLVPVARDVGVFEPWHRPAQLLGLLPGHLFDARERFRALEDFISWNITANGYACTYAIHTDKDGRNPHAHILVANRRIDPKTGRWAAKSRSEFALDANGRRIPVIDPDTGRQKIGARNRKVWKRVNVSNNPLDSKEFLERLRREWADSCNALLPGYAVIDHRSFKARGIERIPTIHEGYASREMEKRGGRGDLCEENRRIQALNRLLDALRAMIGRLSDQAQGILTAVKRRQRPSGASQAPSSPEPAERPQERPQARETPPQAPQEPPKPIRTKKALTDRFKTRLDERLAENERKQAEPDMEETWDLSDPADPLNIGMGWGTGGHGLGL